MSVEIKILQPERPEQPDVVINSLRSGINLFLLPDPVGRLKEVKGRGFFADAYQTTLPTAQEILEGLPGDTLKRAKERIESLGGVFIGVIPYEVVNEAEADLNKIAVTRKFVIAWKD